MDNVIEFPGDYNPGGAEPTEAMFSIASTDGYELHQSSVQYWLAEVSNGHVDMSAIVGLEVFAERYGYNSVQDDKSHDARIKDIIDDDSRRSMFELQREHIGLVILSPKLSVFQKGDLLTLSAQALYDGQHPVNGKSVVLQELKKCQKMTQSRIDKSKTPSTAILELDAHLQSLAVVARDSLPNMTRREFFKHAASVESGERVTNVLKAFAILLAVSEQPGPKEQKRIEERQRKRNKRVLNRARRKRDRDLDSLFESVNRYAGLKEQMPDIDEPEIW